jgi:uncharacterized membrane protein YkgB
MRFTGGSPMLNLIQKEGLTMLGIVLIVILVLALTGSLPRWSHSRNWGYAPSGGLGLVLIIVLILLLMGRI